jgi:hypothetical protein
LEEKDYLEMEEIICWNKESRLKEKKDIERVGRREDRMK